MRDWIYSPPRDRDVGGERMIRLAIQVWERQLRECVATGIPFILEPQGWYVDNSTQAHRVRIVNHSIEEHQRVLRYWLEKKGCNFQTRYIELEAAAD